jgi:hypothetical protein
MTNHDPLLKETVIEHAMRLGANEAAVLSLLQSDPGTPKALATLGRVMDAPGVAITSGSPLYVWCAGGETREDWRDDCPSGRGLWAELCDLRAMFGTAEGLGPYEELQALRDRADASLAVD